MKKFMEYFFDIFMKNFNFDRYLTHFIEFCKVRKFTLIGYFTNLINFNFNGYIFLSIN